MSFFGFGRKDKRLSELKDIIKQLNKVEEKRYEEFLAKMIPYVPDYTTTILSECLDKINLYLASQYSPVIVTMLSLMTAGIDPSNPNTNPYKLLQADMYILPTLFQYLSKDTPDLMKLLKLLFLELTNKFIDYIDKHPDAVVQLVKLVTESQDKLFCEFLLMCVNSKEELKEKYQTIIFNELPLWNPTCVINVLVGYPQMFSNILQEEIERWLTKKYQFLIDDVEQLVKIHQYLWENIFILQILVRTTPEVKVASISFIRKQTIHSFEVPDDVLTECCDSILKPLQDYIVTNEGDSRVSYLFIRFYVLSLADYRKVPEEIIDIIHSALVDPSDFLVAAAAQLIACWVIKFNYEFSRKLFYLLSAAAVNRENENPCRLLLQGIISMFSVNNELYTRILITEERLQTNWNKPLKVTRESFMFPHFIPIYKAHIDKCREDPYFPKLDLASQMLADAVNVLEL